MSAVATDTADRILDAACELIAEEGIDEVRIARVAQRARASSALVHHYFSTREELLEQALVHSFERAGDDRFGDGESSAPGAAAATLALAIRECLPFPGESEREWVLWVELWLRAVREPTLRPVAATLYERYRRWLAQMIRAGEKNGEFTLTGRRRADRRRGDGAPRRRRHPRDGRRPGDGRGGGPHARRSDPCAAARSEAGGLSVTLIAVQKGIGVA